MARSGVHAESVSAVRFLMANISISPSRLRSTTGKLRLGRIRRGSRRAALSWRATAAVKNFAQCEGGSSRRLWASVPLLPGRAEAQPRDYLRAQFRSNRRTKSGRAPPGTGQPNPTQRSGIRSHGRKDHPRRSEQPRGRVPSAIGYHVLCPRSLARRDSEMSPFGAARAKAHFGALGEIPVFFAFVGSRARSNYPHQDMPIPPAAAKQRRLKLVRHD